MVGYGTRFEACVTTKRLFTVEITPTQSHTFCRLYASLILLQQQDPLSSHLLIALALVAYKKTVILPLFLTAHQLPTVRPSANRDTVSQYGDNLQCLQCWETSYGLNGGGINPFLPFSKKSSLFVTSCLFLISDIKKKIALITQLFKMSVFDYLDIDAAFLCD
jgi:hypothetical protein